MCDFSSVLSTSVLEGYKIGLSCIPTTKVRVDRISKAPKLVLMPLIVRTDLKSRPTASLLRTSKYTTKFSELQHQREEDVGTKSSVKANPITFTTVTCLIPKIARGSSSWNIPKICEHWKGRTFPKNHLENFPRTSKHIEVLLIFQKVTCSL